MQSRPSLQQRRLTQGTERVQAQSTGTRNESGFVHRRNYVIYHRNSLGMEAVGKVTEWLQERLGVESMSLNRR